MSEAKHILTARISRDNYEKLINLCIEKHKTITELINIYIETTPLEAKTATVTTAQQES
jgi:hypothetical protein